MPFAEALLRLALRAAMPTHLGTAELQQMNADILRASLFSARTTLRPYLADIRQVLETVLNPAAGGRTSVDGTPITEGMNLADARLFLKRALAKYGYQPDPATRGTIEDLSSDRRLELVVRTNVEISQGFGQFVQAQDPDVIDAYPAQEFYRIAKSAASRDWPHRWRAAAHASGDTDAVRILDQTGRMIARKDSPIWQALGDGAGLSQKEAGDALHNPYPPFAFSSQMWVKNVDRDQAMAMGLIRVDEKVQPQRQEFPLAKEIPQ
jgi:hypothetical protein